MKSVTFMEALGALWRGAPFALLVAGVALGVALVQSQRAQPVFQATASVLASRPGSSLGGLELITPPVVDARVYQRALQESSIVHDALLDLDGHDRDVAEMTAYLENLSVTIESHDLSSMIGISVRNKSAQVAADQANAIATGLIAWDRNRGGTLLDDSIKAIEVAIQSVDAQIAAAVDAEDQASAQRLQANGAARRAQLVQELELARSRRASAVVVGLLEPLSVAQPPAEPISPRPVFDAFIAIVLGLLIGYGLQFARWSLDARVRDSAALLDATGLTPLGRLVIPKRGLKLNEESIGALRASMVGALRPGGRSVLGISSVVAEGEKNGVAISLADSMVRSGYRTLLVDADLAQRGLRYGVDVSRFQVPGLEEYLRDPTLRLEPVSFAIDANNAFDALLPAGSADRPGAPLHSAFAALVERCRALYDVIIFDVPPLLATPDAIAAASACDLVALCVGQEVTKAQAKAVAARLDRSGVMVLGAFLTDGDQFRATPGRGRLVGGGAAYRVKGSNQDGKGAAAPRAYARVKPR